MPELGCYRYPLRDERGFTLLEVVVGLALLLVGVLGAASMMRGAGDATAKNKTREAATSLARELTDVVRSIEYRQLTDSTITSELQARPGLADSSPAAGYTISRRGVVYALEITVCALDDAKDQTGVRTVDVDFCPDSAPPGTKDRNPDDLRRVTLEVSWTSRGRTERNRQSAVVTNPVGGLGPTVTSVRMTAPTVPDPNNPVVTTPAASATLDIDLGSSADTVSWAVNGDVQGAASGTGTSWSVTWTLSGWRDGSYVVHAQGFDGEGRSGSARKIPVVLNRVPPAAPTGFDGGRNLTASHVDLEWHASPEGDVVGYRVYRTDALGNVLARACPPAAAGASAYIVKPDCVDEAAPATPPLFYKAVAIDRDAAGALREGAPSPLKQVVEGNSRPTLPVDLVPCLGGEPGCTLPDGTDAPVGTTVLTWALSLDLDPGDSVVSYRIYRDGTGYAQRYGRSYSTGGLLEKFVDTAPGGGPHTYYVTAVDARYGESLKSLPVVR